MYTWDCPTTWSFYEVMHTLKFKLPLFSSNFPLLLKAGTRDIALSDITQHDMPVICLKWIQIVFFNVFVHCSKYLKEHCVFCH